MIYNKLVRDRIPEFITAKGAQPITHTASAQEYESKLKDKLLEEVQEFRANSSLEEMADILEVIEALQKHFHFDLQELQKVKQEKFSERGGFEKKIILEES